MQVAAELHTAKYANHTFKKIKNTSTTFIKNESESDNINYKLN